MHRWRSSGPAAASLLVNATLIAALLNLGMGRPDRRAEPPAITVLSLAVTKGAEMGEDEGEAVVDTPSPPSPSEAATDAPPPRLTPPVPDLSPIPVMPSTLAMPVPVMTQAVAVAGSSPSAAATIMPIAQRTASAPTATRKGAVDGLNARAPSGSSRSYAAKVRSWLYAHKIYPRRAKMRREEGCVEVRFVLDRAGLLVEGVIVRRSGHAALDEEAAAMLRRASPYPQAPAELRGEHIEFTVPIEFTLPA